MKARSLAGVVDARDVCGIAGFGLLVYGVYRLMPEAAFIVAGGLLLAFAIIAARK